MKLALAFVAGIIVGVVAAIVWDLPDFETQVPGR